MKTLRTDGGDRMVGPGREGFALPAAILALAVVAVLITGGFHMATQEQRVGISGERATQAFYIAEDALGQALLEWQSVMGGVDHWEHGTTVTYPGPRGTGSVQALRVDDNLYYFESAALLDEGGTLPNGAVSRIGMMVRRVSAQIEVDAALTTQGQVQLRGSSEIHGEDVIPSDWGHCPAAGPARPGVVVGPGGDVSIRGGNQANRLTGDPPWDTNEDIGDHTFEEFGGMSWADLVASADIHLPAGSTINNTEASLDGGGSCDRSDQQNWGYPYEQDDPDATYAPCHNYFPVIHVAGDATIQSNGYGQGILLVDGNLDLRGNFNFFGIIIVQGQLETQGGGNPRIIGGAMARNADLDLQTYVGGSVIQYSSCVVNQAIQGASALTSVTPLARRGWVDVTGAGS
ncbi:MAG: hypothetical protein WD960_10345 [Gemmatimonadota bacterium]